MYQVDLVYSRQIDVAVFLNDLAQKLLHCTRLPVSVRVG